MKHRQMSLKESLKLVKKKRPITKPNKEFYKELKKYEQFLKHGEKWNKSKIKTHFQKDFEENCLCQT